MTSLVEKLIIFENIQHSKMLRVKSIMFKILFQKHNNLKCFNEYKIRKRVFELGTVIELKNPILEQES